MMVSTPSPPRKKGLELDSKDAIRDSRYPEIMNDPRKRGLSDNQVHQPSRGQPPAPSAAGSLLPPVHPAPTSAFTPVLVPPTSGGASTLGVPATGFLPPVPTPHAPAPSIGAAAATSAYMTMPDVADSVTATRAGHAPDESRRSVRPSTLRARQQLEESVAARANEPPRSHMTAAGRSLAPVAGQSSAELNKARLALAGPSSDSPDSVVVVYGGRISPGRHLEGMGMTGPHIDRGSWSTDQTTISHKLDARLRLVPGQQGAPHSGGVHFAEIAHHRQQATGGFTGTLGAVPAAVGSNIEDMAMEESHRALSALVPDGQVREVNVARIRGNGEGAGTLETRVRHTHARPSLSQQYSPAHTHLQDGDRNMPDENEVRALTAAHTQAVLAAIGSTSASPEPPQWRLSSTTTPHTPKYGVGTTNDAGRSDYLSGIRSPNGTWRTGPDARDWMASFDRAVAEGKGKPAAVASSQHGHTGSHSPPFFAPPSPPSIPMVAPPAPPPLQQAGATAASVAAAAPAPTATTTKPAQKNL